MKIFDHHHNQLDKNRNNHSRSNHAKMQSFDHIYKRHRHRQSDKSICNDNHFFNVENDLYRDKQETSLFEIDH